MHILEIEHTKNVRWSNLLIARLKRTWYLRGKEWARHVQCNQCLKINLTFLWSSVQIWNHLRIQNFPLKLCRTKFIHISYLFDGLKYFEKKLELEIVLNRDHKSWLLFDPLWLFEQVLNKVNLFTTEFSQWIIVLSTV